MKNYTILLVLFFWLGFLKAQTDTIYTITWSPNTNTCVKNIHDKYNIVFRYGNLNDLERNYKTIQKLENKYGETFIKELIKEHSCSEEWSKYLRSQIGKDKGKLFAKKYKVKYKGFGRLKKYYSETIAGSPDVWTKIYHTVKFDKEGNRIKDEKHEEKINLY